jgi:intracellular septation protein
MAEPEQAPGRKQPRPLLKLVLELGPLGVFFFANARGEWLAQKIPALAGLGGPIFVATALFVVATLLSLAVSLAATRTLPLMPFITGIVVLVFGGLTLWLQNDTFIKMKPTIVNSLFGAILLGGLAFGQPLIGHVLGSVFQLTDAGWRKLTFRWGVFFIALAILNEAVWRTTAATMKPQAATDLWVSFKVFGLMPLTLVFAFAQAPLLMREQAKAAVEGTAEQAPPPGSADGGGGPAGFRLP